MNETDILIAEASIGEESASFIESELGRCILGMAEQEVLAAQLSLETIAANDATEIIRLQERIRLARLFPQWLGELVVKGEQAKSVWLSQKDEEL